MIGNLSKIVLATIAIIFIAGCGKADVAQEVKQEAILLIKPEWLNSKIQEKFPLKFAKDGLDIDFTGAQLDLCSVPGKAIVTMGFEAEYDGFIKASGKGKATITSGLRLNQKDKTLFLDNPNVDIKIKNIHSSVEKLIAKTLTSKLAQRAGSPITSFGDIVSEISDGLDLLVECRGVGLRHKFKAT